MNGVFHCLIGNIAIYCNLIFVVSSCFNLIALQNGLEICLHHKPFRNYLHTDKIVSLIAQEHLWDCKREDFMLYLENMLLSVKFCWRLHAIRTPWLWTFNMIILRSYENWRRTHIECRISIMGCSFDFTLRDLPKWPQHDKRVKIPLLLNNSKPFDRRWHNWISKIANT